MSIINGWKLRNNRALHAQHPHSESLIIFENKIWRKLN